ncbi:XRE family transcriptional regulator [Synechococcales cyanobacterium C]|uniref:XRE family transcriptional regulator n=1 Tax=Petrachloros mirabilis ULC683 TaxID=2781853 RepID=A0A8K2A9G3_9CYAN|nr:helix-turn-helix transcriptional regulator [Petrachloros mirabilis]NCJ08170.1 XRE family transcriptional regulator [Petrachloros mirabilis ULC683]
MIDHCHVGSTLDNLLEEDGMLSDVTAVALKRVLAWQLELAMESEALTKSALAKRMGTSRAALDRLLDPENVSVTLKTLDKAARAVGKQIQLELVDNPFPG